MGIGGKLKSSWPIERVAETIYEALGLIGVGDQNNPSGGSLWKISLWESHSGILWGTDPPGENQEAENPDKSHRWGRAEGGVWEGGLSGGRFYEQLGELKGGMQDDFQFSCVGERW